MLNFLDAYFGYNHIDMKRDKLKMTFITVEANYYYEVMPFGLKNTRATYQRLMDRVFRHLLNKNVKVYMDDKVVKSPTPSQHSQELSEVL